MNSLPNFDRQYWISQLIKEVGLEGVPYEELHKHHVFIGSFFDDEQSKQSAKTYVDKQLSGIEDQYLFLKDQISGTLHQCNTVDQQLLEEKLAGLAAGNADESFALPSVSNDNIPQLLEVPQNSNSNTMRYFDVVIGENKYTVVINANSSDFRIQDQINHVTHTSFFVEERTACFLTGYENIISYYQFANAIQPFLVQKNNLSVFEDIAKTSVFDGVKLEGFND